VTGVVRRIPALQYMVRRLAEDVVHELLGTQTHLLHALRAFEQLTMGTGRIWASPTPDRYTATATAVIKPRSPRHAIY